MSPPGFNITHIPQGNLGHMYDIIIMRQGRESEATKAIFCLQARKTLHSGSYEHRVAKIKNGTFFCMYVFSFICLCVIQYRNWPLRSTILNAHGTNASSDGLCTRRHANEAFSSWFCCNSFRVDRARRGNVCLAACLGRRRCSIVLSASSPASDFLLLRVRI